jgi:hypothetical protein
VLPFFLALPEKATTFIISSSLDFQHTNPLSTGFARPRKALVAATVDSFILLNPAASAGNDM